MAFDELQLTICSVSFHSKAYLEWNWRLANRLNPSVQLKWIIAQNTPPDVGEQIDVSPGDCQIIEGIKFNPGKSLPASYHHGASLNKILALVNTRFVLVLDPDFYIIRRQWVTDVVRHMQDNGLAFLGAPWHPKWYYKYRYFPCVHCLFIDLAQVTRDDLDFRSGEGDPVTAHSSQQVVERPGLLLGMLRRLFRPIDNLQARRSIGKSRDTGYDLYRRYRANTSIKSESFTSVYRIDADYPTVPRWANRFLDTLLPDHLSYTPKRVGYYTRVGFRELGYADASQYGWEEFIWKTKPFGFHLRSVINRTLGRKQSLEQETATLANILSNLTDS